MSSQDVQVQYWDGSQYVTVSTITNTGEVESNSVTFPAVSTTSLRLWQPAGRGASVYNGVMWLTEVEYSLETACSPADTSGDGVVDIQELTSYIAEWKSGLVTITQLMQAIGEWKSGCS